MAEDVRSANGNLTALNKQMREDLESSSHETAMKRKESDELRKKCAKLEADKNKLKKENGDLDDILIRATKDLVQVRQEMQTVVCEHSNCATTIRQLQDSLLHKERQLNMKAPLPHKFEGKIHQLEDRCARLSYELEHALKSGEVTLSAKSELDRLVKSLAAKNKCLDMQLDRSNSERATLLVTVNQLKCEVAEMQSRLKLLGGRSQEFTEYVQLKREVMMLRDQNEQLGLQLKRSKDVSSDQVRLLRRPSQQGASFSRVLSISSCQHTLTQGRTASRRDEQESS